MKGACFKAEVNAKDITIDEDSDDIIISIPVTLSQFFEPERQKGGTYIIENPQYLSELQAKYRQLFIQSIPKPQPQPQKKAELPTIMEDPKDEKQPSKAKEVENSTKVNQPDNPFAQKQSTPFTNQGSSPFNQPHVPPVQPSFQQNTPIFPPSVSLHPPQQQNAYNPYQNQTQGANSANPFTGGGAPAPTSSSTIFNVHQKPTNNRRKAYKTF